MGKWKQAFLAGLDPEYRTEKDYRFGPPATDAQLAALEAKLSVELPSDLRELLQEFNGVRRLYDGYEEDYYFSTDQIPDAIEYYREWDEDTTRLLEWSRNIVYVLQQNGYAEMYGLVIRPFASFRSGQVIAFDHDEIGFAEEAERLFTSGYPNLLELVRTRWRLPSGSIDEAMKSEENDEESAE